MFYVHLGAGAGDLDERADFRCGFTEFIKKNYSENSKVFVVEANPNDAKRRRGDGAPHPLPIPL